VGFGEPDFCTTCPSCSFAIANDTLCCAKFCADLQNVLESPDGIFAGTVLNGNGEVAFSRARIIALEVVKALRDDEGMLPSAQDASMATICEKLLKDSPKTRLRQDRVEAFLRPYLQSTSFSVNLVEVVGVMLQFNARLEVVGWLSREFLSVPRFELDNARERFYTFLEMVLRPENGPVAASLDVDLVWHTMQLAGPLYREFTSKLLGIYVDHIPYEYEPEVFVASLGKMHKRWREAREDEFTIPLTTWKTARTQKTTATCCVCGCKIVGDPKCTCGCSENTECKCGSKESCKCTSGPSRPPVEGGGVLMGGVSAQDGGDCVKCYKADCDGLCVPVTTACGVSISQVFLVDDTLDVL